MPNQIKQFRSIQTADKTLNLIQDQLQDLIKSLSQNPILYGKPIPMCSLQVGNNVISHGLDRNYVSVLMSIPVNDPVTLIQQDSPDRSKFIVLNSSAIVIVDLYVY